MTITGVIELTFSLGLFVNAILFIPQALRIVANRDAKEVSFITFFGFFLIQLSTMLHGFIHHDYLLAYGTLLSMVTCSSVILLIVYYRFKNKAKKPPSHGSNNAL